MPRDLYDLNSAYGSADALKRYVFVLSASFTNRTWSAALCAAGLDVGDDRDPDAWWLLLLSWCRCVRGLQSAGLKVLADIVINHRCAHAQDEDGVWNVFGGKLDWDADAVGPERGSP